MHVRTVSFHRLRESGASSEKRCAINGKQLYWYIMLLCAHLM